MTGPAPAVRPGPSPRLLALGRSLAVLLSTLALVVTVTLPDPSRPVLVLAGLTVAAAGAAAVFRRRLPGTLTVASGTATALLAGALDASAARSAQQVAAAGLLLLLLAALAAAEEGRSEPAGAVTVQRSAASRRLAPVALALGGGCTVAVTAGQDVVPSWALVIAGLAAAVTALVVAAGAHRS